MLTFNEIMAAKAYHERGAPPGAMKRWAFLVTPEELSTLVDEIQANPELGITLEAQLVGDIKSGRCALHINGLMIIAELLPPEQVGHG